jgi:N-sulfoglucosamine sulfohydrolase
MNRASRMIRDERYQYIVNYSPAPRMVLSADMRRPDEEYAENALKSDVTDLLQKHPEHPAVKPFVDLLVNPPPREELYDCQEDPFELKNLADSPQHAEVKARLKAQLEAYQRKTCDPRITGDMAIFDKTRAFVEERKRKGYKDE